MSKWAVVLSKHDVVGLGRSAAMAPLSPSQVAELVETCVELHHQREQIATVLAGLPPTFGELRSALNDLHRLVHI